jgi:hypothetical protein
MTDPTLTPQRGLRSRRSKLIGSGAAAVATAALGFAVPQVLGGIQHRVAPAPVLHAQVLTDVAKFRSNAPHVPEFVVPGPIARVGAPPDAGDTPRDYPGAMSDAAPLRYAWAHAHGGVDATESLVRVSISGASAAATDLQQLRVRLVRCQAPMRGTLLTYSGLGSGIGARYFMIHLDRRAPVAQYVDKNGRIKRDQPFPLRVTDSDQEVFDITAGTTRRDCQWELLLDWTAGSRHGTTVINNHGKPFRTTSTQRAVETRIWNSVTSRWVLPPN